MVRLRLLGWLGLVVCLAGCFDPKAEDVVRDWRPLGPGGPTLATALGDSPRAKGVIWETYAGKDGATTVRVSVEYDATASAGACPDPAKGMRPAARIFLLLDISVSPAGTVAPVAARAQVYTAKGYFEEYPLDLTVMADLMTKTFPLPCADLALPDYL